MIEVAKSVPLQICSEAISGKCDIAECSCHRVHAGLLTIHECQCDFGCLPPQDWDIYSMPVGMREYKFVE